MSALKNYRMCDHYLFSWGVVFAAATPERAVELYEDAYGEKVAVGFPVLIEGDLLQEKVGVLGHDEDGGEGWFQVSVGQLLDGFKRQCGIGREEGEVLGPDETWVDGATA